MRTSSRRPARLRRSLPVIDHKTELVCSLGLLTAHRADPVAGRVRMLNRLRDVLTGVFAALKREFDFASCKGALMLLTGYACPGQAAPDRGGLRCGHARACRRFAGPPGGLQRPPAPPTTRIHAVVTGGMPGWRITLIAVGAALAAAIVAVLLEHARPARRGAAVKPA
jgi:hypothetical protein